LPFPRRPPHSFSRSLSRWSRSLSDRDAFIGTSVATGSG
jgi:hypothetical protein